MAQPLRAALPFLLAFLAIAGGILWWRFAVPPQPGALTLRQTRFADLPGWPMSDPSAAMVGFRRSCDVLAKKPASTPMGRAGYAGAVRDWLQACAAAATAKDARLFFTDHFTPMEVSAGGDREGLFTGYYEPEIEASRTRHGAYATAVYGVPEDLIEVDLGAFRPEWAHEKIAGKLEDHRLVPYPDRAAIDAQGLKTAPILFYARDPIAVFFLHIQGSGRVAFDDGTAARVVYAAQNGQPYTAIGRTLIREGAIPRNAVSLQSIRAWLKTHRDQAMRVMETDRSFVFFREEPLKDPALGAAGSEGVALTPGASLAVDLRLHPLGVPFFVAATVPDADAKQPDRPFDHLLIAQDTGGAIRGAVRGDVFWGFGSDAQAIAGRMKAQGELFVLLPKPVAARLGRGKAFAVTAP